MKRLTLLLLGLGLLLVGCAIEPLKPWERGTLAKKEMQLTTDAVEQYLDEHTYFSKEAAHGGRGVGGGGCGCN